MTACGVAMREILDSGRMIICVEDGPHPVHHGRAQGSKTRGEWWWNDEPPQYRVGGRTYNLPRTIDPLEQWVR